MAKQVDELIVECLMWLIVLGVLGAIICLVMVPGCAAPQDGSVAPKSKKVVGDDETVGANQQGGFNWVWVGGAGTTVGFLTLLAWLYHSRGQDKIQNAYTLDLVRELKGGDHASDSEHRRNQ